MDNNINDNNINNNSDDNTQINEPAYEVVKKKKRKWPVILGICLAGAAAAIAIPVAVINSKSVNLSEFVDIVYDGISGYAAPRGVVDTEGLYNALAGEEKDTARLEAYKNFASSVSAAVSGEKVSNGDSLDVNVTFDEELRKNTGYKVKDEAFTITAEGIDPGTGINLFENASINITGISPDALISVENNSSDEYLKSLEFSADKERVANGDTVAIRCNVTDEELADHGFTTTSLSAMYDVEGLSEYLTEANITKELLDGITLTDKGIIESETADDTYRMIYKLTNNAEYLSVPNTEAAEDIELVEAYLLKRNADTDKNDNPENMIIALHRARLKVQEKEETAYFAFIYPDSYVTADGKIELKQEALADTLVMNTDIEALKETVIKSMEDRYQVILLDPEVFTNEPEQISETQEAQEESGQ